MNDPAIPEVAVMAAAKAQTTHDAMGDGPQWEGLSEHGRAHRMRGAFLALEAAAPYIRAAYIWDTAKTESPTK